MEELQLFLLGNAEVRQDDVPVTGFNSTKVQALLFYLAMTGRPHRRPMLAGLLWGDMPDTAAMTNLRKALANLRKLVGPHLDITRQTVAFNRKGPYWLDVEQFEATVKDTSGSPDIDQLQIGVDLYQGDFLEGFYLRKTPEFEEWTLAQRARLRELAIQALYSLGAHYTEQGASGRATAIDFTTRLLALEPWREEAHRQMMLLRALDGQRSAALAQYEICRQALEEELGVEPGEETTTLYERIRDEKIGRGAREQRRRGETSAVTLPPRPPVPRHNLPARIVPLIGRELELAELARLLTDPDQRLITILGPGGIGKTRLALEVAAEHLGHFEHGVYFVPLAPLESPDPIVTTVAQSLNFSFYEDGLPQQQLVDYLRQKKLLLVLDNFEHLIKAAAEVIELLQAASDLKVLTTSRTRLNVQGEQLFPLEGLDFPSRQTETLKAMAQYSAVKLFVQSARRAQPNFELTADNVQAVAQICGLVEGMPLGIVLAAAWVELLTPAEIATEIGQGLDFLAADLRDVPTRQRSLRAVFDSTWKLLTKRERAMFEATSVFRGGFTHPAAQAVTGTSLRDLKRLVDKSFLHRLPTGRYEVHELLRQYAADHLAQTPGASEAVCDQHSAYYAAALRQWEVDLKGSHQQAALIEMEADSENLRAAWHWAVAQGQIERLKQTLDGLCLFYNKQGHCQDGEAACRLAVNELKLTTAGSDDDQLLLAKILMWQGLFSRRLGRLDHALQQVQQSLTLLDGLALAGQDTRPEKAAVLLQMGLAENRACNYQAARQAFEQSLTGYQVLDDKPGLAEVLLHMGWLAWHSSKFGEARERFEASLAIQQALGDQKGIASALGSLGVSLLSQGEFEESERLLQEHLTRNQVSGDQAEIAHGFGQLGLLFLSQGKFSQAVSLTEKCLEIFNDLGMRFWVATFIQNAGEANLHLGQNKQAHERLQLQLALAREVGERRGIAAALSRLGWVALAEEKYAEARQLLQESMAIDRAIGRQMGLATTLACLGRLALIQGNQAEAQLRLAEALQVATEIRFFFDQLFVLAGIALLLAERGEKERAVELYAVASRYPFVANSHWFEDVFGRWLAVIAAILPPEVVAAARERGQARDLWATAEELLVEIEAWGDDETDDPLERRLPSQASALHQPQVAYSLPTQLTPLIGRETELAELVKLLADSSVRLLTILGSGGVGKTRLALDVATSQLDHFQHGVYFVPLAPLESPASIVPTIAEALNFPFAGGGSPQQQLLNYLQPKQMLVVLDNFEHLLEGAKLVIELLQTAGAAFPDRRD
jgi:predicted ATPase/DNA-binding SARP family transcriptional activator